MISILKITKGNNSTKKVGGVTVVDLCTSSSHVRVLARNFKTCVRDSLLGIIWRPRMKNMRTGIRI